MTVVAIPELLSSTPYSHEERIYLGGLLRSARLRPRPHSCYQTALKLCWAATKYPPPTGMSIEYGEGLAKAGSSWLHHAVAVLNGKAVDLTWARETRSQTERAAHNLATVRYYVVRLSTEEASRQMGTQWGLGIADTLSPPDANA